MTSRWSLHAIGDDALGDDTIERTADALAATVAGSWCAVVEGSRAVTAALEAMTAQARARDDRYRDALDTLREAQDRALARVASPGDVVALRGALDEDVRDLADIFHAVRTVGFRDEARESARAFAAAWSARLLCAALRARGVELEALDGRDLLVSGPVTGEGEAPFAWELSRERVARALAPGRRVVVTGGAAVTPEEATVGLGLAGLDHSAAALAVLLDATLTRWSRGGGVRARSGGEVLPVLRYEAAGQLAACGHPALAPVAWGPLLEHGLAMTLRDVAAPTGAATTLVVDGADAVALGVLAPVGLVRVRGRGVGANASAWRALGVALHELGVTPVAVVHAAGCAGLEVVLRDGDVEAATKKLAHVYGWEGRGRVVQSVEAERGGALVVLAGAGVARASAALRALVDGGVAVRTAALTSALGACVVVPGDEAARAERAAAQALGLT